jgi:hypothetical protein
MGQPKTLHLPVGPSAVTVREPEFNFGRTDIERLFVEVPDSVHTEVRRKALPMRTKAYVLQQITKRLESGEAHAIHESRSPVPGASHQKRIILDVNGATAAELKSRAVAFGSFRELVLCCLEADGIEMPVRLGSIEASD